MNGDEGMVDSLSQSAKSGSCLCRLFLRCLRTNSIRRNVSAPNPAIAAMTIPAMAPPLREEEEDPLAGAVDGGVDACGGAESSAGGVLPYTAVAYGTGMELAFRLAGIVIEVFCIARNVAMLISVVFWGKGGKIYKVIAIRF